MKRGMYFVLPALAAAAIVVAAIRYLHGHTVDVLQPAGQVAHQERGLMLFALLLAVIVVVPVFALTIFIAWRYGEKNTKPKKYNPDWDHSRLFESIWWGIPIAIIVVLSVVAWNSAHSLDPYRALVSNKAPLNVQVVALDWKWLFIYPSQHIASVNQLTVPVNTPVSFNITSDTVMNSFWIPSLGGQIYAMPGMDTQLHLIANKVGDYNGSSANISGSGFASMTFVARAVSSSGFNAWVHSAQQANHNLDAAAYQQLAKPGTAKPQYYSPVQDNLYDGVLTKYMEPAGDTATPTTSNSVMSGMSM